MGIGSYPHSKWDYCTHWVRIAVAWLSKLLKTMSHLSLPSNNSWPFPCAPTAVTQGQLISDIFVVLHAVEDHILTPSQPPLHQTKRTQLLQPLFAHHVLQVLIILAVLCRDLSSPLAPLKLWSPKMGTIAQVWAQKCDTEGSHCPWSVKYGTTQNWQLPEIPD